MTTELRARRPGPLLEAAGHPPLYARMLRLKSLAPSGFLCFTFLEGSVALGILLALAELVSWWGVLVLPATVAVMVKLNDVVAGAVSREAGPGWGSSGPGTGRDPFEITYPVAPRPAGDDLSRAESSGGFPSAQVENRPVRAGHLSAGADLAEGHPGVSQAPRARATGRLYSAGGIGSLTAVPSSRSNDGREHVSPGRSLEVEGRRETSVRASGLSVQAADAGPLNGPPALGQWTYQADSRHQRARQAATHHYE